MSDITLQVHIASEQLDQLHSSGLRLCIAKAVDGSSPPTTVIWSATEAALQNTFTWREDYQVFVARTYMPGARVSQQTQSTDIKFGQECVIDSMGMIRVTGAENPGAGSFQITNNGDNSIYIGASCALQAPGNATAAQSSFYVSPNSTMQRAQTSLRPINKITVWFQAHGETGVMIGDITSASYTIDFTGNNAKSQEVSWTAAGAWAAGGLPTK